jgi:NAD(P)H-flavin reductase
MKATVIGIEVFTENNFVLKLKPEKKLKYGAGQFVMLKVDGNEKPFSISSHPSENSLEFLIKEHDDGTVTPKLLHLKKGDNVRIDGPFGAFSVKDTRAKEIVFIAAGTGVAPFRAMVIDALMRFPDKKITLIFGFRFDFYYEKIWDNLKKKYKNFNLVACCSRAEEIKWKGRAGRVTDYLKEVLKDAKGKEVYICGQEKMVDEVEKQLIEQIGFAKSQIHVEEWKEDRKLGNAKASVIAVSA